MSCRGTSGIPWTSSEWSRGANDSVRFGVDASSSGRCDGLVDGVIRMAVATVAVSAVVAVALPWASAAPATDGEGYVNSTARCAAPNTVVVFGSTDSSRVAICKTPDGKYEYRGVRLSDGAKLIVPAEPSGDGNFFAENNGIGYMVTAKSLVVSQGKTLIRDEPMVDFHGQAAQAPRRHRRRRPRCPHRYLPRRVTAAKRRTILLAAVRTAPT